MKKIEKMDRCGAFVVGILSTAQTPNPNIARESGNVGARSLGLTELWTESHSGLVAVKIRVNRRLIPAHIPA